MPYETLATITKPLKEVKASISYMRFSGVSKLGKKHVAAAPKLIIGIPKAVVTTPKKAAAEAYVFQLGKGADAGKARLMPGKDGVQPRELKGGLAFRFGYVPMLGDGAADRELVDVKALQGGGFELTLPAWFKPDAD